MRVPADWGRRLVGFSGASRAVVSRAAASGGSAGSGGSGEQGRKVKGTIHWVSARTAVPIEVRMYDRLFTVEDPTDDEEKDYKDYLNPESLKILKNAVGEPGLKEVSPGYRCQFERKGYFCVDPDSSESLKVFNLTVGLRDSWAKIAQKMEKA
mgnify:CR=1 FL=1